MYNYRYSLAADVASLMTSGIEVTGEYNSGTKCFELKKSFYPIFNCNISGLTANTTYNVGLVWNEVLSGYNDTLNPNNIYVSTITTDAEGRATFAITANVDYDKYCALWFGKSGGLPREYVEKSVYLGHHTFVGKVYNVTKTAEDRVSTITKPLRKM